MTFNGSKGRLEHKVVDQPSFAFGSANVPGAVKAYDMSVRVHPLRKPAYAVEPRTAGKLRRRHVVMLDDCSRPSPAPIRSCARPTKEAARDRSGRRGGQPLLRDRRDREAFDICLAYPGADYPRLPSRTAPVRCRSNLGGAGAPERRGSPWRRSARCA